MKYDWSTDEVAWSSMKYDWSMSEVQVKYGEVRWSPDEVPVKYREVPVKYSEVSWSTIKYSEPLWNYELSSLYQHYLSAYADYCSILKHFMHSTRILPM